MPYTQREPSTTVDRSSGIPCRSDHMALRGDCEELLVFPEIDQRVE